MRFSDPIDQGSDLAEKLTQAYVDIHRRKSAPQQKKVEVKKENGQVVLEWEHVDCIDCDSPIEPERLEHARIRCVSCQGLFEEKEKRYGRR